MRVSEGYRQDSNFSIDTIVLKQEVRARFGFDVPYCRLEVIDVRNSGNEWTLGQLSIPTARLSTVLDTISRSYRVDSSENEDFMEWVQRKGLPFFTELLEEQIMVSLDDLPQLLSHANTVLTFPVKSIESNETDQHISSVKHSDLEIA